MTDHDKTQLVHIAYQTVTFDALVTENNTVMAIFYDDCDITNLLPLFGQHVTDELFALAVAEAMKG